MDREGRRDGKKIDGSDEKLFPVTVCEGGYGGREVSWRPGLGSGGQDKKRGFDHRISTEINRVLKVRDTDEICVWDAKKCSAALRRIETGQKYGVWQARAFLSSDGGHFVCSTGRPYFRLNGNMWRAVVIDIGGHHAMMPPCRLRD